MKLNEIKDISETMRHSFLPQGQYDATLKYIQENGTHVGDQDQKQILTCNFGITILYGIKNNDSVTSFVAISKNKDDKNRNILQVVYTDPAYRGKKDVPRIIWFMKDQDAITLISSGVQSDDAHALMQSLSKTTKFDMHWFNTATGETEPYDFQTDIFPSKHRATTITPWRIVIEGSENPTLGPRFYTIFESWWHIFPRDDVQYG